MSKERSCLKRHCYKDLASPSFAVLLNSVTEQPLTEEIIQSSAHLRRSFRLKLPDAIIAATALYHEVPLITRNVSDFKKRTQVN